MDFWAIGVELANPKLSSICQIGLVMFKGGRPERRYSWTVDPEDYFDPYNVALHGIDENWVAGFPAFPIVRDEISNVLPADAVLVSHTHHDRVSIKQGCERYDLEQLSVTWLDSARVARRTWEDIRLSGYGLVPVADRLGIEFRHHDAVEDARAGGEILLNAISVSGKSIPEWIETLARPWATGTGGEKIRLGGFEGGALSGEVVAFTGALSMPRAKAAQLANFHGAAVEPGVTKKTTIVIVGDQDVTRLAGKDKSAKHLKAEKLRSEGHSIQILRETDFLSILEA